jgi:hypothetical protein
MEKSTSPQWVVMGLIGFCSAAIGTDIYFLFGPKMFGQGSAFFRSDEWYANHLYLKYLFGLVFCVFTFVRSRWPDGPSSTRV